MSAPRVPASLTALRPCSFHCSTRSLSSATNASHTVTFGNGNVYAAAGGGSRRVRGGAEHEAVPHAHHA